MKNKKLWMILPCTILLLIALFTAWVLWANTALTRTDYTVTSAKLPQEFEGFCIAQVSDLHNAEMGKNNQALLDMLWRASPDIIVITGDVIDARRTDTEIVLTFMRAAVQIAPCYMITGNHEAAIDYSTYLEFEAAAKDIGVTVLHNSTVKLERNGKSITLLGLDDYNFQGTLLSPAQIHELAGTDDFCIMLSHRPEYFDRYAAAGIDVTFSGHAHGGQFRLPLIGGLYAPGQGVLPEYDCGVYTCENANMVVSRGIGNSSFPLRFNNRPELVIVTLTMQDE